MDIDLAAFGGFVFVRMSWVATVALIPLATTLGWITGCLIVRALR